MAGIDKIREKNILQNIGNYSPVEVERVKSAIRKIKPDFHLHPCKVFLSYCQESRSDTLWLAKIYQLVYCLQSLGIDIKVDFLMEGNDMIAMWVSEEVKSSKYLLVVPNQEYTQLITNKKKATNQQTRTVIAEGMELWGNVLSTHSNKIKVIILGDNDFILPNALLNCELFVLETIPRYLDVTNITDSFAKLARKLMNIKLEDLIGIAPNKCEKIPLLSEVTGGLHQQLDLNTIIAEPERFFTAITPLVTPFWRLFCSYLSQKNDYSKRIEDQFDMLNKEGEPTSEKELCYQSLYKWWRADPNITYQELISLLRGVIGVDTRVVIYNIEYYVEQQQQKATTID